jgi:PAS domain S-box-containing protein
MTSKNNKKSQKSPTPTKKTRKQDPKAKALVEPMNKSEVHDLFLRLFHVNPIPTAITRLQDGLFLDVNDAYLNFYSLARQDVIGHTSAELNLPLAPKIRSGLVARVKKEEMIRNLQLDIPHPSGVKKTILASLQILNIDDTDALMLAFSDITDRVLAERQVRKTATNMSATEQMERQRISQILHDDLQQNIFAVKMQLSFLAEAIKQNNLEAANVDLGQLDQWLADAIATTRQLSIDLSPPVLHGEGLTEALLWLASQMKTQYSLDVTIEPNDTQVAFEDDLRSLLFQSVRELLFNVVKHSGTLAAHVVLEQMDGHVNIIVSDKGKGFDMQTMTENRLDGLKRMRDRLFLLGCNLVVESEPGKGTRITIEAPIAGAMD